MFPNQFSASLWGDEAFSAVLSQKPLWEMIRIVSRDTSPPLYYLSEHFWFKIFGNSELAIRSLSFIFHLGTALILFLLAKMLWDKKTALWAAILGFLNPFLFTYAFEGRMYALLALTTTLSFYGYFQAFFGKQKYRFKWKLFYAVTAALALYSHHFAIFAIFVQGIGVLALFINKILKEKLSPVKTFFTLAWPFFLTLFFYIPWLPSLYYQIMLVKGGFWLGKPDFKDLLELTRKFLVGAQTYQLKSLVLTLTILAVLCRRWQLKNMVDKILLFWFLAPLVLTWLISQMTQSIFFDRYMLFAIPATALILVSRRRIFISPLIISLLIVIFIGIDWQYFTHPTKGPFRQLVASVKQEQKPTDALINWNSAAHHLWETKYYGLIAPIYSPGGPLPFFVGTSQMTQDDVVYLPPQNQRIGVITSGPAEEVKLNGYYQSELKQFDGLKVIWLTQNH
ncbi:hypothetical protein A2160_03825 [Candidatus Beckwithbacteria bacterium RBG_13_42_9]|uniref:Glycosyltransferase RgtA/B/C/D-like domain-containing protein n=1 Tax=Candidatus Beckwithbacteria bacterium RBG_13_42_9 TaxID=1797457 RepID=A0A1F5E4X0_9BACT|nr:MAG: hypothetical protein A2160_03825 [Candidatus Beckwithbacteria bacterium RBG_13_42_9]